VLGLATYRAVALDLTLRFFVLIGQMVPYGAVHFDKVDLLFFILLAASMPTIRRVEPSTAL
jgi:hypothetical protein